MQRKEDRKQKETDEGVMKARALETPSMNPPGRCLHGHLYQLVCFQFIPRVQKKNRGRKETHVQKTETNTCLRIEIWGRAIAGTVGPG